MAPALRAADVSALCDHAARVASRQIGVPLDVLRAITRTETGRRDQGALRPWPWTVNMEGKGLWFSTRDEALAYVLAQHNRGARSFDIGCFQINYRWHGDAFRSLDDMFEPERNAIYAAQFLGELHAETGNWSAAAGAYHSRTTRYADAYRTRFDRVHASLSRSGEDLPTDGPVAMDGPGYPLFTGTSAPARLGSLLPVGAGSPVTPLRGTATPLFTMGQG